MKCLDSISLTNMGSWKESFTSMGPRAKSFTSMDPWTKSNNSSRNIDISNSRTSNSSSVIAIHVLLTFHGVIV